MHPTVVVTGKQQCGAIAMQGLVILPSEVFSKVSAVYLGTVVQFTGQLGIGQGRVTQGLPAMLITGAMFVSAADFLTAGQCVQAFGAKFMAKSDCGQGIEFT